MEGRKDFNGKYVMITGANGGIGFALVKAFAARGANIIAHARQKREDFEERLANTALQYKVSAAPIYFDLTDSETMKQAVRGLMKQKILVDVLVNNAGISHGGLFQMTPVPEIRAVFEVNLFSQMELTQLVLKMMVRKQKGAIVNISSNAGVSLMPGNSAYGVSKSAVIAWTKVLAAELGAQGIRVNAVAPGLTDTQMGKAVEDHIGKDMIISTAMNRKASTEEIAAAAVFLASDQASFINGQTLNADGGATIWMRK